MPENFSPDRLAEQMAKLTREMERRNSFWRAFALGMVRGIGMVIGATVLTAIALTLFWKFAQGVGIEGLVQSLGIEIPGAPSGIDPALLERHKTFFPPSQGGD